MSDKEKMLNTIIKSTLEIYNFKNDKVIFIRRSFKNNKDLKNMLQNYNYGKYDLYFIDDEYFENKNDYAIVIDKRYFKI